MIPHFSLLSQVQFVQQTFGGRGWGSLDQRARTSAEVRRCWSLKFLRQFRPGAACPASVLEFLLVPAAILEPGRPHDVDSNYNDGSFSHDDGDDNGGHADHVDGWPKQRLRSTEAREFEANQWGRLLGIPRDRGTHREARVAGWARSGQCELRKKKD